MTEFCPECLEEYVRLLRVDQKRLQDAEDAEVRKRERADALLRNASAQIGIMRNNNDELKARVKELEILIKGKFTTLGEILHARESRSSPARKE